MIRDGRMYECKVYVGKRLIFIFRDSMNLLPSPLDHLASNICPELGAKGSIPHHELTVEMLTPMKDALKKYFKQD